MLDERIRQAASAFGHCRRFTTAADGDLEAIVKITALKRLELK